VRGKTVAAEISTAILIARAGAQDPLAIPSICRVSAALQYTAGGEYTIIVHALKVSFLVHGPVLP